MQMRMGDEEYKVVLVEISPSVDARRRSLVGRLRSRSYGKHSHHIGADGCEGQGEDGY